MYFSFFQPKTSVPPSENEAAHPDSAEGCPSNPSGESLSKGVESEEKGNGKNPRSLDLSIENISADENTSDFDLESGKSGEFFTFSLT